MERGNGRTRRIKIISMGAAESGKSCLIKRYCEKRFVSKYLATLGIDFGVTRVRVGENSIRVNIFDMAGQSFYLEVRNEFYKDTQGALLVYDIGNRMSFECLGEWLIEMRTYLSQPSDMDLIVFMVCGNKCDVSKREVTETEGRLWAETKGFLFYETSAKSGENVAEMFEALFGAVTSFTIAGEKPKGLATFKLGYTPEQVALVKRIMSCDDNHSILSLERGSLREEINRSYRHLAILLHPDKNQAPGSAEAFKILAKARENLLKLDSFNN